MVAIRRFRLVFRTFAAAVALAMALLALAPIFQLVGNFPVSVPAYAAGINEGNRDDCTLGRPNVSASQSLTHHKCTDLGALNKPHGRTLKCLGDWLLCAAYALETPEKQIFSDSAISRAFDVAEMESDRPPPRHRVTI